MSGKVKILSNVFFVAVFVFSWLVINYFYKDLKISIVGAISGIIAYLLSPRLKTLDSQSGKQIQIKWIFLKKLVLVK